MLEFFLTGYDFTVLLLGETLCIISLETLCIQCLILRRDEQIIWKSFLYTLELKVTKNHTCNSLQHVKEN